MSEKKLSPREKQEQELLVRVHNNRKIKNTSERYPSDKQSQFRAQQRKTNLERNVELINRPL